MKACRMSKGSAVCQGSMLSMEQEVVTVINKLPVMPKDLPIFVTRKSNPNDSGGHKDFNINKKHDNLDIVVKRK